ncbi:DNA-deoxyinosine glycosylase [Sphingomonas sp.]|jgi:hypoxanthine-DNA glycosylase|uniref:DNA-deoxyinosine glycosylase n=1 Tax=Sphingomonas sp. TaxID=28214 RepID=UPI002DF08A25|nr:DNA-deoxyinosine glycosylase [Sphingomonas sp.]HEV2568734.1 DNA-deoxyinosine glycosylase [Sphingomonas sp.]
MRHASFPAVVDAHTHTLLLGSLPGAASLAARRYYAHPRNQFWRLMGDVSGLPLPELSYQERLQALLSRGVGLWDVVADAERQGSLDAAIKNPAANDLQSLVLSLPSLRLIAFNGGTAGRIGTSALGRLANRYRFLVLPSSSPAHAIPYERKLERWRQLVDCPAK